MVSGIGKEFKRFWPAKFMRRASLFLIIFVWVTAGANPIVSEPLDVYISTERLAVMIGPAEAEFSGTFTFKSVGQLSYAIQTVSVEVPVWFPVEARGSNSPNAAFWSVFDGAVHELISPEERRAVEQTLGLKVRIGKAELPAGPLLVSGRGDTRRFIPQSWEQPGCRVLLFYFAVSPSALTNGNPVTISYRQPLVRSNGEGGFVYVPIFAHLPRGISTSDTNRYSVALTAAPNCELTVTNGLFKSRVEAGQHLTLSPRNLQPIRAAVRSRSN